jgi:hypothetical protein
MNHISRNFDLQRRIVELPLSQQKSLFSWLGSHIAKRELEEKFEIPKKPGREIVEIRRIDNEAYALEKYKCNKPRCFCKTTITKHQAWFGYQWRKDRVISWYVGKELAEKL